MAEFHFSEGQFMKMVRKFAFAAAAAAVMSVEAGAQTNVNFYTTGAFGAGCTSTVLLAASITCNTGSGSLTYNFNGNVGTPDLKILTTALPTANVQYGSFVTDGTVADFGGISFTLNLFQTNPSIGNQGLVGSVTGAFAPNSGGLLWGPVSPTTWQIGAVKWTLDVDAATNSVRIDPPNTGGPSLAQTVRGTVSVVPEPSTYALMAAGLAALGMVARRRRTVA